MTGKKRAPRGTKKAKTTKPNNDHKNNTKNRAKKENVEDEPEEQQIISDEDRKHHQRVLDVFRRAFEDALSSPSLTSTLQSIKEALYNRDFARAFGDPDHLDVYAARWSPTRALCYASVLSGIYEHLDSRLTQPCSINTTQCDSEDKLDDGKGTTPADIPPQHLKLLSIGGGAAELVAFGAFLSQHLSPLSGSITLLDSGPWQPVITKLTAALTTAHPISQYASAAAKLSNTALIPASNLTATFHQQDALALTRTTLPSLFGTSTGTPLLITLLFTLNELFTLGGIGKTTAFLLNLTATIPLNSLLLVVDSPGSYSETSVGKDAKRYPMQWLLDRVLLGTGTQRESVSVVEGRRWVKLESRESAWFRLAGQGLEYPIGLENMRYQMHLYRVEGAGEGEGGGLE